MHKVITPADSFKRFTILGLNKAENWNYLIIFNKSLSCEVTEISAGFEILTAVDIWIYGLTYRRQ
jgi:hypothetical protein